MKVRIFILFSSVALFAWLTATFVRVVPLETYDAPMVTSEGASGEVGEVALAGRETAGAVLPR